MILSFLVAIRKRSEAEFAFPVYSIKNENLRV